MATYVGLAGDWHGNTPWAVSVLEQFAAAGITEVYHVGDFGIWPGGSGAQYLSIILGKCQKYGIRLWITPGNHEDYTKIVDPEGPVGERQILGGGPEESWEVALLPRGYTWEVAGRRFLSLGGAPSIDFEMRQEGKSWWPEEMIRDSDLERLEENSADIMLAHDAPDGGTPAVQRIIDTPASASGWSAKGLAYCAEGRMKMNQAVELVNPRVFVHGHMHVTDEIYYEDIDRKYVSLGPDGVIGNVAVLELESLNVGWAEPASAHSSVPEVDA